jgi:hypothetical protein
MPRFTHEALVQLVRAAPEAIAWLLREVLAVDLPAHVQAHVTATEIVDLNLAEYRADVVLTFGPAEQPDEALVVEAQGSPDPRKRVRWPVYVAGVRARLGCPVTLVVLTLDEDVAQWCRTPIDLGRQRGWLYPLVIGPQQIPVITDVDQARRMPELAVLSAAAHGHQPGAEHIAHAALLAVRDLDSEHSLVYPDFILARLGEVARAALELLMPPKGYEYQSDFARKYYGEGIAAGIAAGEIKAEARILLKQLRLKGFEVSPELQSRVETCTDLAQLDLWIERILGAHSLADVFTEP